MQKVVGSSPIIRLGFPLLRATLVPQTPCGATVATVTAPSKSQLGVAFVSLIVVAVVLYFVIGFLTEGGVPEHRPLINH